MNKKKINSIEGLRTIGWIGVFICHFRGAFFPGTTWWTDLTPLKFIYSGNAYVRLLFVISGFVLSYKYFVKEKYDNILSDIIKRYFRLMPPVLISELFVCFLMKIGAFRNAEAAEILGSQDFLGIFNQFNPSILSCLKEALVTTYLSGANGYIGPLWTMVYEYLGAVLVLCAISILRKNSWRWIFYIVFMCAFSGYYNYFILGMMICDLYVNSDIIEIMKKFRVLHIMITALGYIMLSMVVINDEDKYSRIIFGIGIVLFMIGVLSSKYMEHFFGNKLMVLGGKIAYSAYIVHWPIIESVSCALFLLLCNSVQSLNLFKWSIFAITFLIVLIVCFLLERLVEPLGATIAREFEKVGV